MLTVDELKRFGADTEEGLKRCLGKEAFYLMLVKKVAADPHFGALEQAIAAREPAAAFEAAHALKGVLANLALTPLLAPVAEMTEALRAGEDRDYGPYLQTIQEKKAELDRICAG